MMTGMCNICGKPAMTTCPSCGRLMCPGCVDPLSRLCKDCVAKR